MKKTEIRKWAIVAVCALSMPMASQAASITIGDPATRQATLESATVGATGGGNGTAAEIGLHFGGTWIERGSVEPGNGATGNFMSDLLTINIENNINKDANGTWSIDPSFWTIYGSAAISLHVGGNPQDGTPDHFAWLITPDELTGTWSYDFNNALTGDGGELSNLKLFGRGTPDTRVPDGGSTLTLFGLAIGGVGLFRRKLGIN